MFSVELSKVKQDVTCQPPVSTLPELAGNSEYADTNRRCKTLAERDILFIGTGVSGGEEGARYGPSIMPGGNPDAWYVFKCYQHCSGGLNGSNRAIFFSMRAKFL